VGVVGSTLPEWWDATDNAEVAAAAALRACSRSVMIRDGGGISVTILQQQQTGTQVKGKKDLMSDNIEYRVRTRENQQSRSE